MIVRVKGICITGDCECMRYDGSPVDAGRPAPPFHRGCTCYTTKAAPPQPKPGRALNEKMAEVMGWALPSRFDMKPEHPYVQTLEALGLEKTWVYETPHAARPWNPSTRIANAFEVMARDGFVWEFSERELHLSVSFWSDVPFVGLLVPWADFTDPDGTRNRPEAYSFGICWAALAWLEGQKEKA